MIEISKDIVEERQKSENFLISFLLFYRSLAMCVVAELRELCRSS